MAIWYVWARLGFVDLLDTCTFIRWVLQLSHMQITVNSSLLDSWFMGVEWGHNEGIILNYHIWIYTHMYGKLIFYSLTIMLHMYYILHFYARIVKKCWFTFSLIPKLKFNCVFLSIYMIYEVYWIKKNIHVSTKKQMSTIRIITRRYHVRI